MPYLITTLELVPTGVEHMGAAEMTYEPTDVRAVAGLDAYDVYCALYGTSIPDKQEAADVIARLPSSGGRVGQFADGSMVEVREVQWRTLCDQTGLPYPGSDAARSAILDAAASREDLPKEGTDG